MTQNKPDEESAAKYEKFNLEAARRINDHLLNRHRLALAMDANIYLAPNMHFEHPSLRSLRSAMDVGEQELKLLVPDIWEREIIGRLSANLRLRLDRAVATMEPGLCIGTPSLKVPVESARQALQAIDPQKVVQGLLEAHVQAFRGERLPVNSAAAPEIFDAYFKGTAPFDSSDKDKKHEFPDAFALSTLEAYASMNDVYVIVVTRDQGPLAACLRSGRLIGVSSIERAGDLLRTQPEVTRFREFAHFVGKLYQDEQSNFRKTFDREVAGFNIWLQPLGIDSAFRPDVRAKPTTLAKVLPIYPDGEQFKTLGMGHPDSFMQARISAVFDIRATLQTYDPVAEINGVTTLELCQELQFMVHCEVWRTPPDAKDLTAMHVFTAGDLPQINFSTAGLLPARD